MPLGKTGTCDDHITPSKIGWFLTFSDEAHSKIALAVLLRGNTRRVKGPTAAQVAGGIYRRLREQNYFADSARAVARDRISFGSLWSRRARHPQNNSVRATGGRCRLQLAPPSALLRAAYSRAAEPPARFSNVLRRRT